MDATISPTDRGAQDTSTACIDARAGWAAPVDGRTGSWLDHAVAESSAHGRPR
jgi:hypothetical protein